MATVEIIELIKPETGEKFYPYAHLNGVKGAELLPRIGGSVQTTLPTPIFQIKDALNAQFYPQTHADAVIGLAQAIESNQFFAKESDGNGGFRIKLKDEFTGFYANSWVAAGGVGTGGGGGGGGLISTVYGESSLGTIYSTGGSESLTATFSAFAIDKIWQAVVALQQSTPNVSLVNGANYSTLTVNGTIAAFYTKAQVDGLISGIRNFEPVSVQTLPTASADTMYKLYLVPSSDPQSQNIKDEYITYRTGSAGNYTYSWEQVGSTAIDLSGYATQTWANQQFLKKTGGDINGDIFHEIEEAEEGSDEIIVDERWRITENGDATFGSLSVNGVDFSTINSRVNTLWNARNNYLPLAGGTMTGAIVMSGANIVPSADSANSIGSSSARFGAGYIRNLYPTFLAFMSDDGQTQVGSIGMGSGYANITLNGTPSNSVYNFNAGYGFFHGGNGDVPCGRSDHRWETLYGVNADLTGDIDLASTSHIDIGPARIEYDATSGAIHVTTNQTGNNAPTIGFYSDGFNAAGGVGDGSGGGGYGVEQITTNEDGTIDFHFTGGDITTVDLNHEHPQYMKHVECASQSEYNAITTKDSGTIYTIGVGPTKVYIGTALIYQEN